MSEIKVVTIGAYGFEEDQFFSALIAAHVDTFVDIRQRRGMRGSKYAFANSTHLQAQLQKLGIRYVHIKELAPDTQIREKQKQADQKLGVAKSKRDRLDRSFIEAYRTQILTPANLALFFQKLESDVKVVALFCVERQPNACHRSILANKLNQEYQITVEHILP